MLSPTSLAYLATLTVLSVAKKVPRQEANFNAFRLCTYQTDSCSAGDVVTELGPVSTDGSCIKISDTGAFGGVWINDSGSTLVL